MQEWNVQIVVAIISFIIAMILITTGATGVSAALIGVLLTLQISALFGFLRNAMQNKKSLKAIGDQVNSNAVGLTKVEETVSHLDQRVQQNSAVIERLEQTQKIFDNARDMLKTESTQSIVLHKLMTESISNKFREIPNVSRNKYREFLESAAENCSSYKGIMTQTIGAYSDQYSELRDYLFKIVEKDDKTRIFVIRDGQKAKMYEELDNPKIMRHYWDCNGTNMRSYWILESEVNLLRVGDIADCGIYDDEIMISFIPNDPTKPDIGLLIYDIIRDEKSRPENRLLEHLNDQKGKDGPFIEIAADGH